MSQHTYTIDRFEDNGWAVLEREDGKTFNVPSDWLPTEVEAGDVLQIDFSAESKVSTINIDIDDEATAYRLEKAKELRASLPEAPEGDIKL
jgi:hypothetical protein